MKIQTTEFAASVNLADKGEFEAYVLAWSGADPDASVQLRRCKLSLQLRRSLHSRSRRAAKRFTNRARPAERKKTYDKIAARVLADRPIVYLYHRNWLWAFNAKLAGVRNVRMACCV